MTDQAIADDGTDGAEHEPASAPGKKKLLLIAAPWWRCC